MNMASFSNTDLETLLAHCRSKVGVEERRVRLDRIQFRVLCGSLDFFATFHLSENQQHVLIRCKNAVREELENSGASVRVSDRMKWSGPNWKWTEIGLDRSVPLQTLISLINESYEFAITKFDEAQKRMLSFLARKLPPRQLLGEMIDDYGLQDRKADIEQLLLPALRLTTSPMDEAQIPLGSSKVGGHPDLPASLSWPRFRNGRPLSFLAQIDLGEIPPSRRLADLPATGILYVFSGAWHPDTLGDEPQQDCSQVLFHNDAGASLTRHSAPEGTSEHPAAKVTFHSTLCLPTSINEPSVEALNLDTAQADRFNEMMWPFNYVASHEVGPNGRHLLLGYADWVQRVIEPVKEQDLRLLFQLASDPNTKMCWGDGGYIYCLISKSDLQQRRFSNITTGYQCG
jgi:uncharacterized protein YwqG/predicted DNA-binding protein (MmcQ/YjbR family)